MEARRRCRIESGGAALVGALLLQLLVLDPRVVSAESHPVLSDFQIIGEYLLEVDAEQQPDATILLSKRAAAIMVVSDALPEVVLIFARSLRVDGVPRQYLIDRGDGGRDLASNVERHYLGDFKPGGSELVLPIEGRKARLVPRPSLIGLKDLDDLLSHSPNYQVGMDAYGADPDKVARLKALAGETRIRVFFGSWCAVCKNFLPNHMRLERELEGSRFVFEYYGLDFPPEGWQDPEVKGFEISGLPTAVVYRGGREIGRYVGADGFRSPETSLIDLLGN